MLTVIGCGNLNRCDDGVGIIVVRQLMQMFADETVNQNEAPQHKTAAATIPNHHLQKEAPPHHQKLKFFDAGTDGMGVMFEARGAESLILIDASNTGTEAGAIFEVPGAELEGKPVESFNLHDFRWDHALYAGRKIYQDNFPTDVMVYLIEAGKLEMGDTLTPKVAKAAEMVTRIIAARIKHYAKTH